MTASYPRRPPVFAAKFCRAMLKTCLANEIGADVCWMLSAIANTEDASGYRRAVSFWNAQLAAVCGFSEKQLDRARGRAVEAGWLHYIPGKRGTAPRYWTLIPSYAQGLDDAPTDEQPDEYSSAQPEQAESMAPDCTPAEGVNRDSIGGRNGGEMGVNRDSIGGSIGAPFFPIPIPSPSPDRPPYPKAVGQTAEPAFDPLKAEAESKRHFTERWNAAGLKPLARLNASLASRLTANLLDPDWAAQYPAALERAGQIPFLRDGEGRQAGRLDVFDFLKEPDFVRQILDGRFDPSPAKAREPPARASTRDLIRRSAKKLGLTLEDNT